MEGDCMMKSSKLYEDSDHDSLKENRPPSYQRTKKSKQVCILEYQNAHEYVGVKTKASAIVIPHHLCNAAC